MRKNILSHFQFKVIMSNTLIFSILKHIIWPTSCPVCGKLACAYCPECLESLVDPFPLFSLVSRDNLYGKDIPEDDPHCFALTKYAGSAREVVLRLKYKNVKSLGYAMGRLIGLYAPRCKADAIVPIPLHKYSQRFYNQADLLSQGISSVDRLPVLTRMLVWNKGMCSRARSRHGRSQTLPASVFRVSSQLKGMRVILVDDVYTTGGTMLAAVNAIESVGGKVALGMVWGRTLL